MEYDQIRGLLRLKYNNLLKNIEPNFEPIANLLADKLMALEFAKKFSTGNVTPDYNITLTNCYQKIKRNTFLLIRTFGITLFAFLSVCLIRKSIHHQKSSGSLVYGISKEHYSGTSDIESLGEYLDHQLKKVDPNSQEFYLLQTGSLLGNQDFTRIRMVPHIGIAMLQYQSDSRRNIIITLCKRFFSLLKLSICFPEILEIGPEYVIDYYAFSEISSFRINSLITTQSQMLVLPLVFYYEFNTHRIMFWYSDNSTQIKQLRHENQTQPDYSYLCQKRINLHFVWTNSWASQLQFYTNAKIIVVGPIFFKLLEKDHTELTTQSNSIKKILVFDVTPKQLASSNDFYFSSNMQQFIIDLVLTVDELISPPVLMLKPKRKYNDSHDSNYVKLVKSFKSRLQILSPTQDLVTLIRSSTVVICAPFTSPAIIAKFLGKPVFYYSPSLKFNFPDEYEGIKVVSGRKDLFRALDSIMNQDS